MTTGLLILSEPKRLCYVKAAWASAWTEAPLLVPISITSQAAPGHSVATFRYRYGRSMMPAIGSFAAETSVTTKARPDLKGKYVRIDITGLGSWWGIITDVDDQRDGNIDGTVASGTQTLTAYGLTWLLDQAKPIRQTKVKTADGSVVINRGLAFNAGTDGGKKRLSRVAWKNRDADDNIFTSQSVTGVPAAWRASHAIQYLLDNFSPKNSAGSVLVPFALDTGAAAFLDYEIPQTETHGRTLWDLINGMIDRRRGLGMHAYVDADSGQVKLKVWSQNSTALTLQDSTIPANPNQVHYDFDTKLNIKQASVSTSLQRYYDQVLVESERVGSVFTVRPGVNFDADWTTDEEDTYNEAATGQTGFSDLSSADKAAANMDRRAADDLASVMSWWRLADDWSGKGAVDPSGEGGYAFPLIDDAGTVTTGSSAAYYLAGLRVEAFLPMRAGVDYTATISPETADADAKGADFLPPIVLLKTPPVNTYDTTDAGWVHAERLNQSIDSGSSKRPYTYSVDVEIREDAPGLILKTIGKPQHYITADRYTANGSYEFIDSGEGINGDDWIGTIYVLGDDRCRGCWPVPAALPSLDLVRQLTIQIGGAHLDYIVPGTIVGTKLGKLQKTTGGGFLRDDRKKCQDIAKLAHRWYGVERRSLQVSFKSLVSGFDLGHLVTDINSNSETINTVITSVQHDLQAGTTSVSTQFGELEFSP